MLEAGHDGKAAVQLHRLFRGVTDTAKARECAGAKRGDAFFRLVHLWPTAHEVQVAYPVFADSRVFRFGTHCRSTGWPERSALHQLARDGAGGDARWWLWWQLELELLDQEPSSGSGWV